MNGQLSRRQIAQIRLAAKKELYRRDFLTYATEQLKIQTKVAGEIKALDPHSKPLQRMFLDRCKEQLDLHGYVDGNIIKGRQQGSSTITQGYLFWRASTTPNFNTLLIAQNEPTTRSIFEKVHFFYEHLDKWVRPAIRASSKRELVFDRERKREDQPEGLASRMDFQQSQNMLAGTGMTRQALHLSECSKYRQVDIDLMVSSLYPCLYRGPGSVRIKESTAFIGGTWFRACCDAARQGETPEFFLFVPAYLEPDNSYPLDMNNPDDRRLARMSGLTPDEQRIVEIAKRGQKVDKLPPFEIPPEFIKFRRVKLAEPGFDEDLWEQEFPTEYESSWISRDSRVFNHERLYEMREEIIKPLRMVEVLPGPKLVTAHNVRMHAEADYTAIWEEPIVGEFYDIGADVAAGIEGGDWSTAVVWKRRTREQVAEMHIHIDPADFGTLLFWLGLYYLNAQIAVEWTGGYGVATEGQLKRLNYPNFWLWRHRDEAVPIPTRKTGWHSSAESKAYLVSLFRTFVNHKRITIHSQMLLDEMFDFVQIPWGDRYDYRGNVGHDDLVMAAGIGLVISDDENFERTAETSVKRFGAGFSAIGDVAQGIMGPAFVDNFDPRMPRRTSDQLLNLRGTRG